MALNLNNAAMLSLLQNDVEAFNQYRKDNPDQPMDFYRADLRVANLTDAKLRYANLRGANLQGAYLWDASLRGADLRGASLQGADLMRADLRGADLEGADLEGADLRDAELLYAILRDADLRDADLTDADLQDAWLFRAKLRGARLPYNAPAVPKIHQKLAQVVNENNLEMGDWHSSCGTTHCRAGWVVTLAGEPGRELEGKIGANAAAALIYMASDPDLEQIPDWFASNAEALADIQAMATKQRG